MDIAEIMVGRNPSTTKKLRIQRNLKNNLLSSYCLLFNLFFNLNLLYSSPIGFFFFSLSLFIESLGEGDGTPLQYSCLENPMDRGVWWTAIHGVVKSQTRLSIFPFTFHFHALEKEMATYSSVIAWRIPGMGEPGGLPSMGLHRVGHD